MSESPPPAPGAGVWDRALSSVVFIAGGLTLAFMTVLSTFNVLIMRKALNDPIPGAEDLMVLALVTVVAIAIPFGGRTGAHIEIELLEPYISRRFANLSLGLMKLIGIGLVVVLSWQLWVAGGEADRFGQASQQLVISFGPFYRILAISAAVYAIILIADFVRLVTERETHPIALTSDDDT